MILRGTVFSNSTVRLSHLHLGLILGGEEHVQRSQNAVGAWPHILGKFDASSKSSECQLCIWLCIQPCSEHPFQGLLLWERQRQGAVTGWMAAIRLQSKGFVIKSISHLICKYQITALLCFLYPESVKVLVCLLGFSTYL